MCPQLRPTKKEMRIFPHLQAASCAKSHRGKLSVCFFEVKVFSNVGGNYFSVPPPENYVFGPLTKKNSSPFICRIIWTKRKEFGETKGEREKYFLAIFHTYFSSLSKEGGRVPQNKNSNFPLPSKKVQKFISYPPCGRAGARGRKK